MTGRQNERVAGKSFEESIIDQPLASARLSPFSIEELNIPGGGKDVDSKFDSTSSFDAEKLNRSRKEDLTTATILPDSTSSSKAETFKRPIACRATRCVELLEQLASSDRDDAKAASNLLQRLNVWNLSSHVLIKQDRATLDWRLRKMLGVQEFFILPLEKLQNYLIHLLREPDNQALSDNKDESEVEVGGVPMDRGQNTSAISHGTASSFASSSIDLSRLRKSNPLVESKPKSRRDLLWHPAEEILDNLFDLSSAVQKPSTKPRTPKTTDHYHGRDDLGKPFQDWVQDFLRRKFRHLNMEENDSVRNRIADSIVARRRNLAYFRGNWEVGHSSSDQWKAESPSKQQSSHSSPVQASDPNFADVSKLERRKNPTPPLQDSFSVSTLDQQSFVYPRTAPRKDGIPENSSMLGIPESPAKDSAAKEIQCPYCCRFLPTRELQGDFWVSHYIEDITPYICLLENCPHPDSQFGNRAQWLEHARTAHDTHGWISQWTCPLENHSQRQFDDKIAFMSHLKREHGKLEDQKLSEDLNFGQTQIPSILKLFAPCPVCGPEESKDMENDVTHVEKHLFDFAQLSVAISALIEDLAEESITQAEKLTNERDFGEDHTLSTFTSYTDEPLTEAQEDIDGDPVDWDKLFAEGAAKDTRLVSQQIITPYQDPRLREFVSSYEMSQQGISVTDLSSRYSISLQTRTPRPDVSRSRSLNSATLPRILDDEDIYFR